MDNTTNDTDTTTQTAAGGRDDRGDGKLAAEAARRRVQAREAAERADAAEQEAAQLRAQIAELRLSQARQAVTAKHPELTGDLIEKFAPDDVDADTLEAWADKALGLVVALRGEAPVDADTMTDTERELAEMKLDLARQSAVADNPHVTAGVLDALCRETTPEGITNWAAAFEQIAADVLEAQPAMPAPPSLANAVRDSKLAKVAPGKWAGADNNRGLAGVARKLQR